MHYYLIDAFNFTLIGAAATFNNKADLPFEDKLTNILSGMLKSLKNKLPDGKWYAVWDTYGGTQFRKNIDPDYKSNRTNSLVDFKTVISYKGLYEFFGIDNIEVPQSEADDIIFTMSKVLKEKNPLCSVTIISRDNDLLQVVQAGYADSQYDPVKKENKQIPKYSIVDFKSLVGDPSDSIKGVPGIGEKTALKIISGQKQLTEEQEIQFEKCKDIVDASRHPRLQENYSYIMKLINSRN